MGNFIHVNNYVLKAEHTPDLDVVVAAKLKAAAGLVHLDQKEYAKVGLFMGAWIVVPGVRRAIRCFASLVGASAFLPLPPEI